ncbi:MAG: hypothetical protein ACRDHG_03220 [Anaerolineales bacterium]
MRIICFFLSHRWQDAGNRIILPPHHDALGIEEAIFQPQICARCGADRNAWLQSPFYPERRH